MIKRNCLIIFGFFLLLLLVCLVRKPNFYRFVFSPQEMVGKYLKSQDIFDPQGNIKDRVIIPDSDIYLASGYLYAIGKNPADYNFQHPPLLKYLYGFSLILFGNPYFLQIILGFLFITLTYFLGLKIARNYKISFVAAALMILDPSTSSSIFNLSLDLGQSVFGIGFVLLFIYYPSLWLAQGVLLGFLLASKFWSMSLFIFVLLVAYRFLFLRNFKLIHLIKMLIAAIITYVATYLVFFTKGGNITAFFLLQLKMVKFMVSHDAVSTIGGQLWLFISGFYNSWWNKGRLLRGDTWSAFWPISLGALCFGLIQKKLRAVLVLPSIVIFGFFTATLKGAPFTRYFVFITPYLYISFAIVAYYLLTQIKKLQKIKRRIKLQI
jgi:hypothetical protein